MLQFFRHLPSLPELDATGAIDILVVAFLVYQCLMVVRGTRAGHILVGHPDHGRALPVAVWAGLEALRFAALAHRSVSSAWRSSCCSNRRSGAPWRASAASAGSAWAEVSARRKRSAKSCWRSSIWLEQKTGALIVLERDIGLRTFIESGVRLEAHISRDLLLSIFSRGCRCTTAR